MDSSNAALLAQKINAKLPLPSWIAAAFAHIEAEEAAAVFKMGRAYRVMVSDGCRSGFKDWTDYKARHEQKSRP